MPPKPPTPPKDYTFVYWLASAGVAATVGGVVLYYLKWYDPLKTTKAATRKIVKAVV